MHASPLTILSTLASLALALTLSMSTSSCNTHRHATEVVTHSARDTLYINKLHYDSIFIDRWQSIRQKSDTVYLEQIRREYKYQLLRDTIRAVRVDSIPVIKEVEVVREVTRLPWWSKALSMLGLVFLMVIFGKIGEQIGVRK